MFPASSGGARVWRGWASAQPKLFFEQKILKNPVDKINKNKQGNSLSIL